jgi:hypothetical protein
MKPSNTVKVYLAIAAVTMAVIPAGLVPALSAGASTSACGSSCTSPSVESEGTGEVLTASGSTSGSSVVMSAASTTSTAEDWTPEQEGDVANAVSAGVLSAKLNMLYSTDQLVEFQSAPGGVPSDLCVANTANSEGEVDGIGESFPYSEPTLSVALEPCGITAQSLWILDASNEANGYVDLINAGYAATFTYLAPSFTDADDLTSPFAEPAVLTVSSTGKLALAPLSEIGGVVSTSQMWASWSAPAQSALRAKVDKT